HLKCHDTVVYFRSSVPGIRSSRTLPHSPMCAAGKRPACRARMERYRDTTAQWRRREDRRIVNNCAVAGTATLLMASLPMGLDNQVQCFNDCIACCRALPVPAGIVAQI